MALERFVRLDHDAELRAREAQLRLLAERLSGVPHVQVQERSARETGRSPLLELVLDERALGRTASAISRELQRGEPPVHLSERRAAQGVLTVDPSGLRAGDERVVADRVRAVLT